jgi:hypothetical protein
MHEPRPVFLLLVVQATLALGLAGWWALQSPEGRQAILMTLWLREGFTVAPPAGLLEQPLWLMQQRLPGVLAMRFPVLVAVLIGMGEGLAHRRRAALAGFQLSWWTTGVVLLAILPGSCLAALVLPWPLLPWWVGSVLMTLGGVAVYLLVGGRPAVR